VRILYVIPARAGSKRLIGKNIKLLGGKPLISYSIEFALQNLTKSDELCISTDDDEVIKIAQKMGIQVPFIRPKELATDNASTHDVLIHAIEYYEKKGKRFDSLLLLQPTSPFRIKKELDELFSLYHNNLDMVVSVKKAKENPYYTLFEEEENGFLIRSKEQKFNRDQDCPKVYILNGSMYLINIKSLKIMKMNEFKKIKKILMPDERSVDIDTFSDWALAEFYLSQFQKR
jgi:N-acylneuraminate cytidylyltransferase